MAIDAPTIDQTRLDQQARGYLKKQFTEYLAELREINDTDLGDDRNKLVRVQIAMMKGMIEQLEPPELRKDLTAVHHDPGAGY